MEEEEVTPLRRERAREQEREGEGNHTKRGKRWF